MRIYREPIVVLFDSQPRQLIWRGRLLVVTHIQGRWFASSPWWSRLPEDAEAELLVEQETWRVEAGNASSQGGYELTRTLGQEDWRLQAVMD